MNSKYIFKNIQRQQFHSIYLNLCTYIRGEFVQTIKNNETRIEGFPTKTTTTTLTTTIKIKATNEKDIQFTITKLIESSKKKIERYR